MMWKIVLPVLAAVFVIGPVTSVGLNDISIEDKTALIALEFAVIEHNRIYISPFISKVSEVLKVQRQGLASNKYVITVIMGKTPCRKANPDAVCEIPIDARFYQCTFTVLSTPSSRLYNLKQEC